MSFCLRPNVCKKCGKPLTLFEGWTCLECENAEQEHTTLKQIIEKHNMDKLAYDEMSDFERDVLEYAEQEPCEDAISRQAVLDKLNEWEWQELYLPIHFKENIIDELPSVQPKAKTGHWTALESRFALGDRVKCSECGQVFVVGDDVSRNYCPNCGADMRGGE